MTYWGAPSPGGSKFYLGSSGDTAWNHDILWKARVEKEVAELDPEAEELQELSDDKYLAGVDTAVCTGGTVPHRYLGIYSCSCSTVYTRVLYCRSGLFARINVI